MITPNGGVFGRNPKFNNVTVEGDLNVSGGMTSTPNDVAPTSNVTIGPSAGANLVTDSTDNICIGSGAGDVLGASGRNVAIGTDALGAFSAGAASITNTTAGTASTNGTQTGVLLEKASGDGEMAVYPTVTLVVTSGAVGATITITQPGSEATVASGLVFKTSDARIDPNWRGTLASVTGGHIAIGHQAGLLQTTASENTLVGANAGDAITTANSNTCIGSNAGGAITTGIGNVCIGTNASNTITTSTQTTAVGSNAFVYSNSGTAIGSNARGGDQGLAVGAGAGGTVSSGTHCVFLGAAAASQKQGGGAIGTLTRVIVLGRNSTVTAGNQTDQIIIGTNIVGEGTGTTLIGDPAITQARMMGGTFLSTGANGQSTQLGQSTTLLTGLSGATVTATNLIPANCILLGVTARVTTAITGATSFDIGDGSTADRFGDDIAIAADTTANNCIAPALITAATNVVLTANGSNFTGGDVRLTAHYMTLVAPTS
jgi:hypothetical protein